MEQAQVTTLNQETGRWEKAIPEPYSWPLLPWAWRRLIGWRDEYGRKAQLLNPIREAWLDWKED